MSVDDSENEAVAVDTIYHATEIRLLDLLGVSSGPCVAGGNPGEGWFGNYLKACRKNYLEAIPNDAPHPMPEYWSSPRNRSLGRCPHWLH